METKEEVSLTHSLQLTDERGIEIVQKVFEHLLEEKQISDVIKKLICDFDLDTKELVLASYYLGKMQDEEFMNFVTKQMMISQIKSLLIK